MMRLTSAVERLLRLILRVYPRAFRARFERDVIESAREDLQSAADTGVGAFATTAARELTSAVAGVVPQHRLDRRRAGNVLSTVIQDLRYAARLFSRERAFSAIAILTIALAIGIATSLFSVIDAAVLRPLPYPQPEQIVRATVRTRRVGFGDRVMHQPPSLVELKTWQNSGVFSALAAWNVGAFDSIIESPVPDRANIRLITEGYLAVHGLTPHLGRDFSIVDTLLGAEPVVMLSHAYWQTKLGADPTIVGRTVRYDGASASIVGVLPAGFYPNVTLWRPMQLDAERATFRGSTGSVHGRLRSGLSLDDAARQLSAITPAEDGRSPAGGAGPEIDGRVQLTSVLDETVAPYRTTVAILAGAVGLIVLIACVNVAGLLLARGSARQAELAIRASIGAGRLRLIRQLLVEAIALSLAGCVVGTFIAWISLDALLTILPLALPPGSEATLDFRVLVAAAGLAALTGLVFGLWPAVRLSRVEFSSALGRGTRRHGSALSRRGGQALIAAEVALAVTLVIGAGLMIRSFARLTSVDLGFDPDAVVAFTVVPVEADAAVHAHYYPRLLQAIGALPGIAAAGAVDHFALGVTSVVVGASTNSPSKGTIAMRHVLPGYFEAMGLPLSQGRFPSSDDGARVAVVNEAASRALFPNGAVGRQLTIRGRTLDVVGVLGDFLHGGPAQRAAPEAFLPWDPKNPFLGLGMTFVVRPKGRLADLPATLHRTAESVGPRVMVGSVRPGREWFGDRVATPRHRMALLGLLGAFGLMLALIGIFSMTVYTVAHRTREIGVRMALGARPTEVVGRVVRDAAWPVLLGLVAGLGVAFYASRVVRTLLFQTTPHDPETFAVVALVMAVSTLVAAWVPARRAAHVDPVAALRAD